MRLSKFIGKKLTDIGTDEDTDTLWLEFAGGHQIHIKRDEMHKALILVKAKETAGEIEERREEIKKARAEARAEKAAKTSRTKAATVKPAKKPTKKSTAKTTKKTTK